MPRAVSPALRQAACTSTVPPDRSNYEWTLQSAGTGAGQYWFVLTYTVGTTNPTCIEVYPTPSGYPGPLFELKACNSDAAQILTLSTTP